MQPSFVLPRGYPGQNCSIARTLEVLGDRWTLLIVRDSLFASRRFDDYLQRLGLARNVLAERLARLVDDGILERIPYQETPRRHEYRITPKGRDLLPVLVAMIEWGDRHYAPSGAPRLVVHAACGGEVKQSLRCEACGEHVLAEGVSTRPGPGWRTAAPAA
jgi:DNA-binding HxlR family transcriptional regulator